MSRPDYLGAVQHARHVSPQEQEANLRQLHQMHAVPGSRAENPTAAQQEAEAAAWAQAQVAVQRARHGQHGGPFHGGPGGGHGMPFHGGPGGGHGMQPFHGGPGGGHGMQPFHGGPGGGHGMQPFHGGPGGGHGTALLGSDSPRPPMSTRAKVGVGLGVAGLLTGLGLLVKRLFFR